MSRTKRTVNVRATQATPETAIFTNEDLNIEGCHLGIRLNE